MTPEDANAPGRPDRTSAPDRANARDRTDASDRREGADRRDASCVPGALHRPDVPGAGGVPGSPGAPDGGLATGFRSAEESPGLLMWQVTNRWQAAQRAALKPYGLTHVQFVLLASLTYLQAEGTPVTQRRLADHAATDPMMTSQVLRVLESRGLLTRRPHPTDARALALSPTPEGRALADAAVAAAEACDADFFAPLDAAAPSFARALRTLR